MNHGRNPKSLCSCVHIAISGVQTRGLCTVTLKASIVKNLCHAPCVINVMLTLNPSTITNRLTRCRKVPTPVFYALEVSLRPDLYALTPRENIQRTTKTDMNVINVVSRSSVCLNSNRTRKLTLGSIGKDMCVLPVVKNSNLLVI